MDLKYSILKDARPSKSEDIQNTLEVNRQSLGMSILTEPIFAGLHHQGHKLSLVIHDIGPSYRFIMNTASTKTIKTN